MKIGVCGDVHWSEYSSILRQRGEKYSLRLENLIKSVNWFEELCSEQHCDEIVYCGDFFDKSVLSAEEITALNDVKWSSLKHYFLVGNHEMNSASSEFSSAHLLDLVTNISVVDKPTTNKWEHFHIHFIPYMLDSDKFCFDRLDFDSNIKHIVFSHNDIAGVQYGNVISKTGFKIDDIQKHCDLFINGHIHNGAKIADKVINIGNLTGQNFSEDATRYEHMVFIVDTDDLSCAVYVNPYAINFSKLDFTHNDSIEYINEMSMKVNTNAVVCVKCNYNKSYEYIRTRFDPDYNQDNKIIPKNCNVICSKFVMSYPIERSRETTDKDGINLSTDHIEQFKKFILENLGNTEIVNNELTEVCK